MRRLGSLLALVVCALPAGACLNDRELLVAEREFRSSYLRGQTAPSRLAPGAWGGWAALAGGVLLCAGAWRISRKQGLGVR
jgi:hypothetical protein